MPSPPYIELEHVTKKFGANLVLKDISLKVPYGGITGVIGPSGSGKTTILNILIGFIKPTTGKIYFQSRDIFKDMKNVNTLFGFAVQDFSFYDDLSVKENLEYFGKLYHVKKKILKDRIVELLKLVDLTGCEKVLAKSLSSGMKRRLDIACALIHDPKVLILDEPTQDLDPVLRKSLVATIKRIKAKGRTIILTSHLLGEIDDLCDNLAILYDGEIIEFSNPEKLKKQYKKKNLDEVFTAIVQKEDSNPEKKAKRENNEDLPSKEELEEVLGKKNKKSLNPFKKLKKR